MKFVDEFKEFIAKGNVMDMAVGVVIGGAFKGIVDSLVADVMNPLIAFCMSGISKAGDMVADVAGTDSGKIEKAMDMSMWVIPGTSINIGNFISSVINFLIMAFVIFCLVKVVNKVRTSVVKEKEIEEVVVNPIPTQEELLAEIRDTLVTIKEQK